MSLTTDKNDPCLEVIKDDGQQACYLILSDEERAKGFVRPVRRSYVHVGATGPKYTLRELTEEEHERYNKYGYMKYEMYPEGTGALGRFWPQAQLDKIGKGCGQTTTMGLALCETYARNPSFYGATFCSNCRSHYPVGENGEFVWTEDGERVGS